MHKGQSIHITHYEYSEIIFKVPKKTKIFKPLFTLTNGLKSYYTNFFSTGANNQSHQYTGAANKKKIWEMRLLVMPLCICTSNGGNMSVPRIHSWYSASSTSTNGRNIGSIIKKC